MLPVVCAVSDVSYDFCVLSDVSFDFRAESGACIPLKPSPPLPPKPLASFPPAAFMPSSLAVISTRWKIEQNQ